ncbi:MAG: hypothetical protein LBP62_02495 [Clostridiales bacterium]|jgi:exonuclease SbcC|nr:hypothetical protein [Clostridiales bacterium]
MKPIKLEFSGLFNFSGGQTVDFGAFPDNRPVYFFGASDGGRDAVADILLYALFGKTDGGAAERFVVNKKTGAAGLKLSFSHGGESYYVEREFRVVKGSKFVSSDAVFYTVRGDVKYLTAEGAAVGAEIEKILGRGVKEYKKAVFIDASEAVKTLSYTDAAQAGYFGKFFGIDRFNSRMESNFNSLLSELKIKRAAIGRGASAKEIAELNGKKSALTEELAVLNKKIAENAEKAAKIKNLAALKERLEELNSKIDGLTAEKDKFAELERKIEISDAAAKILPAYKRRESLIKENEEFIIKRGEAASRAAGIDAEIEAAEIESEKIEAEYAALLTEYAEKREKLKEEIFKNAGQEGADGKAGFLEILSKRKALGERLSKIREECAALEKKIKELTVDPEFELEMSKANSFEGVLKRLLKERYYLEKKSEELDDKIDAATLKREDASARVLQIEERLDVLERERLSLIGAGDIYKVFTNEHAKYNRLAHSVGKVDVYNDCIKLLTKKKQTNNGEIERDTRELDRAEATRLNAERNLYNVNAKAENAQREREKVSNANYFAGIANAVRIGEFCPICNNVMTYKQPKTPLAITPVDMEINKLRDDRTRAEEILANTAAVIAGLNSNILHMRRLNQDLSRDESFYIDCINDILKEEGFESVQALYEAYIIQKDKYERLKVVYDRAGEILSETETQKDELREAENERRNADREVSIYSEQYNERKHALSLVDTEYDRSLKNYASLNSLSEYDTPEKILEHMEKMAEERLECEKELERKTESKRELEKLIAECDNLEILLLQKAKGEAYAENSEGEPDAAEGGTGENAVEIPEYEERAEQKRAEAAELKKRIAEAERQRQSAENEIYGLNYIIAANEKQIANLSADYIDGTDIGEIESAEALENLVMGYFLREDSVLRVGEYKIALNELNGERDITASLIDAADGKDSAEADELTAAEKRLEEVKKELLIVECKLDSSTGEVLDADAEDLDGQISAMYKFKDAVIGGEYADYVTTLNASAALSAASAIAETASDGRFTLVYDGGIRVKDKLFGDKYRTLNTLCEREKLTVGLSIAAALADIAGNGGAEVLFIGGVDAFGADCADALKAVAAKIGESRAFVGILTGKEIENAAGVIKIELTEDGSVLTAVN